MVSVMFYLLGGYCWRFGIYRCGLNRRTLASLCALLAAVAYAALAGFSLPTLRALLMFAVVLIALQLKSKINLLQALALALAMILLVDPLAVGSISLWLSFGALMVIAFMQFRFPAKMSAWRQLLVLQGYFIALFAPLGVLIFGQLNLAGLPANLVAIPLLSFVILPLVLMACLLSSLGLVGASLLFSIADQVLGFLLDYLAWLLESGLQSLAVNAYPAILLLVALAACRHTAIATIGGLTRYCGIDSGGAVAVATRATRTRRLRAGCVRYRHGYFATAANPSPQPGLRFWCWRRAKLQRGRGGIAASDAAQRHRRRRSVRRQSRRPRPQRGFVLIPR